MFKILNFISIPFIHSSVYKKTNNQAKNFNSTKNCSLASIQETNKVKQKHVSFVLNARRKHQTNPNRLSDPLTDYFDSIGNIKRLSLSEEKSLGSKVKQMTQLIETKEKLEKELKRELNETEWATEANIDLGSLKNILKEGNYARNKIVEANLKLVVRIATIYKDHRIEPRVLIQEGNLGLIRAAEKFDPDKGFRFSTYAYPWITTFIKNAREKQANFTGRPKSTQKSYKEIQLAKKELSMELNRPPSLQEIAAHLKITLKQVEKILLFTRQPISLNIRIGEGKTELAEFIPSELTGPLEFTLEEALKDALIDLIKDRPPLEKQIFILFYGLNNEKALSVLAISKELNVSRDKVTKSLKSITEHVQAKAAYLLELLEG